MKRYLWLLAIAPALMAAECDTTDSKIDDSGSESCWYTGALQIAELSYSCTDGSPDQWYYYTLTDGLAGDVTIDIFETGDANWPGNPSAVWDEQHGLDNIAYDDVTGSWYEWELGLDYEADEGSWVAGQSTSYVCSTDDETRLTWMVTMYDDSNNPVDCAVWGHDTSYWLVDMGFSSCLDFNP